MKTEELGKHIEKLEDELETAKRQLEELNKLEQNSFKLPMPEVHKISDEEIGKRCKAVSYFAASSMMSRQFGVSVHVPAEFCSRSLAELVYRCTES